jgi:polyisoprenoid-binding protein YceI
MSGEKKMSAVLPTTGTKTAWAIDVAHSDVQFAVRHMMMSSVKGHFPGLTGTIWLNDATLADSEVEVEIEAASVTTRDENRDAHLRSADFLDVENFPNFTFKSTKVTHHGADQLAIAGDLTIKGVTLPVVLDATVNGRGKTPYGTEIVSFSAETTINRKDFGLTYNMALETGGFVVGDKLKIAVEVEAVLQEG